MDALDRFTQEITGGTKPQSAAEQAAMNKAKKDALFESIMAEELANISGKPAPKMPSQSVKTVAPQQAKAAPSNAAPQQAKAAPSNAAPQQAKKAPAKPAPQTKAQQVESKDGAQKDDMAKKKKKKKSGKTALYAICAVVLVLAIAAVGLYVLDGGTIVDNLYIAGVNVGGLTKTTAVAAVNAATNDVFGETALSIQLPDCELTIPPEVSALSLDAERAVDEAYNYGRVAGLVKVPGITKAPAEPKEIDLTPYFTLDNDAVRGILNEKADEVFTELVQTEVKFEERPAEEKPEDETDGEEDSDENSDEEADEDKEPAMDKFLIITKGTPACSLNTDALFDEVVAALTTMHSEAITFAYDITEPDEIDLQKIHDENCTEPVNASLNEETNELTDEIDGYGFDLEAAKAQFEKAEAGETIEIPFEVIVPEVTTEELKKYMFQDKLASYDSKHTAIANRTKNLELACAAINGTVINDGEIFSFNKIVGERTASKGYKNAQIYSNGQVVEELGGGCCQVASTIYLCALLADLQIVERYCHYFEVTYVPRGMDATIYWGSLDFRFKNNTGYPIRIDASVSGGYVHIAIYGTETKDYTVKMTYSTISSNSEGVSVVTYKHKYDANGNEISCTKEASSYYHIHKEEEEEEEEEEQNPDDPSVDPDPSGDPDPSVDPNPSGDPDPSTDPDPSGDHDPSTDPDPSGDPDTGVG